MKLSSRGLLLLAVQATLVLSTAGKYLWERHTRPMVWTPVQISNLDSLATIATDPENRYVLVQLLADACSLPPRKPYLEPDINLAEENRGIYKTHPVRNDTVRPAAKDGKLIVVEAEDPLERDTQEIIWDLREPCTAARLPQFMSFYVPAGAPMPQKLATGETMWALVTIPAQGPPRPVELAYSDAKGFHHLGTK